MRNNKGHATISSTDNLGGTFDRSTHKPFRLDGRGFNKDLTIKDQDKAVADSYGADAQVKIPSQWQQGKNRHSTLSELKNNRKMDSLYDLSYDLDGDGVVGNRDLVLSKLFDKDKDGKLNAEERRNAEEAIRNGIDDKMTWGIE